MGAFALRFGGKRLFSTVPDKKCHAVIDCLSGESLSIIAPIPKYDCVALPPRSKIGFMESPKAKQLVVVVDDDELMRDAVQGLLKSVGLRARSFVSAEEFLNSCNQLETACLIADIRMPGMSGLDLQAKLNADHCRVPIIFMTAHGDEQMRMHALRAGAVEFLAKPFDDEILLGTAQAALEGWAR